MRVDKGAGGAFTGIQTVVNGAPVDQVFTVTVTVDTAKYFEMNTRRGAKYVRNVNISNGVITNLLTTMTVSSVWPKLFPGANNFAVIQNISGQTWTLTYYARYGGL